jgi:hypothetical protein
MTAQVRCNRFHLAFVHFYIFNVLHTQMLLVEGGLGLSSNATGKHDPEAFPAQYSFRCLHMLLLAQAKARSSLSMAKAISSKLRDALLEDPAHIIFLPTPIDLLGAELNHCPVLDRTAFYEHNNLNQSYCSVTTFLSFCV